MLSHKVLEAYSLFNTNTPLKSCFETAFHHAITYYKSFLPFIVLPMSLKKTQEVEDATLFTPHPGTRLPKVHGVCKAIRLLLSFHNIKVGQKSFDVGLDIILPSPFHNCVSLPQINGK